MVSPSKVSCHPVGCIGVMTRLPQPQKQLCAAVAYSTETYIFPSSITLGINSTNSCWMKLWPLRGIFIVQIIATDGIGAEKLTLLINVETEYLFPLDHGKCCIEGV